MISVCSQVLTYILARGADLIAGFLYLQPERRGIMKRSNITELDDECASIGPHLEAIPDGFQVRPP